MRILWDNIFDKYPLIFSSQRSGFPAANVQHPFLVKIWRSLALDEWIMIDAGAGQTVTIDCAFIAAHNLTAAATIRIQANDTNDWAAPSLDEAMTWDAGTMAAFFAPVSKRFVRYKLTDAANTDGYIEIGRLSCGSYLQMPPIEPGSTLPTMTTTRRSVTDSSQAYGDKGVILYVPEFAFPLITQSERVLIEAMWRAIEHVLPVFLVVWEDSLSVQRPIYCRIDQDNMPWKKSPEDGLAWSVELAFKEAG